MTYSPLINETLPPVHQKWSPRPAGVKINGLIVHHHATTGEGGIYRLVTSSDKASANYIIRTNGSLIGSVPEEYRAWTSGSMTADGSRITVEVQNSTGAPDWQVSDAAFATLVRLYADLAARHGFTPDRAHISGHRDWAATSCPGPYLYPRLNWVAQQAAGGPPVPVEFPVTPAPAPTTTPPVSAPTPTPPPRPVGRVTVNRDIAAVQRLVGATPDGVYGPDTTAAVMAWQSAHGLVPDGIWGPLSDAKGFHDITALQRAVRAVPDNVWGPDTAKRVDAVRKASAWGGIRFPYGVKFAQNVVGTTVDGSWGPKSRAAHDATVTAIQRAVGSYPDGIWGPDTEARVHEASN